MREAKSLSEIVEGLEGIKGGLENLSLQQEMTEPRRRTALTELIRDAETALEAVLGAEQRQQREERRLMDLIVRLGGLDEDKVDPFKPSAAIVAESSFVKEQLRGLGDPANPGESFGEARDATVPSGLESLASALLALTPEEEDY